MFLAILQLALTYCRSQSNSAYSILLSINIISYYPSGGSKRGSDSQLVLPQSTFLLAIPAYNTLQGLGLLLDMEVYSILSYTKHKQVEKKQFTTHYRHW